MTDIRTLGDVSARTAAGGVVARWSWRGPDPPESPAITTRRSLVAIHQPRSYPPDFTGHDSDFAGATRVIPRTLPAQLIA